MARYNHFKSIKYPKLNFKDLNIGDNFRYGIYKNNRYGFVIATKTGDLSFVEKRSKKEHVLHHSDGYVIYGINCV